MFEQFTYRGRRVIMLAQEEAGTLGRRSAGSGHLLIGLIDEGSGDGARILERLAVPREPRAVRFDPANPPVPGADIRSQAVQLAEIRGLLATIGQRLVNIERHLGLDSGLSFPGGPAGPADPAE